MAVVWGALVRIVTAFTIGHSITLSLAALDIVTPPPSIIEPAIALSIVFVGADNLVRGDGRDLRAWVALVFGLVHGFGFANVLREFGLPREALGWSLFSFNFGVEIGQLMVVLLVSSSARGDTPPQSAPRIPRGLRRLHRGDRCWHLLVRPACLLPGRCLRPCMLGLFLAMTLLSAMQPRPRDNNRPVDSGVSAGAGPRSAPRPFRIFDTT